MESCSKAIEKQITLDDDDFCQGDDDEMEVDEDHIFDVKEKVCNCWHNQKPSACGPHLPYSLYQKFIQNGRNFYNSPHACYSSIENDRSGENK